MIDSSTPPTSSASPATDDQFVDAALAEHARLGPADHDDALVAQILTATVERPDHLDHTKGVRRENYRVWAATAISVAAIVALLVAVLRALPYAKSDRTSDEVHLVVTYAPPSSTASVRRDDNSVPASLPPQRAPRTEATSPTEPVALVDVSEFRITTLPHFAVSTVIGPPLDISPKPWRDNTFHIAADTVTETVDRKIYSGNVQIRHALYDITAERVWVTTAPSAASTSSRLIVAESVSMETVESLRPGAEKASASARRLEFEPVSGDLLLTGVTAFRDHEGIRHRIADDERLSFSPGSYAVERIPAPEDKVVKYVSPLLLFKE